MSASPIRVAVGGGKGGVGKSLVAVNLGVTLAAIGLRTVLVDGDLGTPTLHTLLGVDRIGPTIRSLLDRKIARLDEAMVGTGVPRLSLVAGTSLPGSANISHQEKLKLVRHVRAIDADVVIVDVGAGASFHTLDLFGAGDLRLIVATPELTSLQNAYCFLKAALTREIAAVTRTMGAPESWAKSFDGRDVGRMGAAIEQLGLEHPEVARAARARMDGFGARWVGNRVDGPSGTRAIQALTRLAREYLSVETPVVACVPLTMAMERSVAERSPAMLSARSEPLLTRAFDRLAEEVVAFEARPAEAEAEVALRESA